MAAGVPVMAIDQERFFAITCNIALCCGYRLVFADRRSPADELIE
jgi:hypothetical protein